MVKHAIDEYYAGHGALPGGEIRVAVEKSNIHAENRGFNPPPIKLGGLQTLNFERFNRKTLKVL